MSKNYGQRLKLRLFLEGIEVPVIAANVRSAPNSPSAASIQIPPLAEGTRFLPRTLVHLYFLDLYEQDSPLVRSSDVRRTDKASPTAHERTLTNSSVVDDDNSRYKLLFGGEMVGFSWTKNSGSRSLVLQCADWSNYWDYAYQWNNTDIFGPGYKAMFSGGATSLFTDFLSSQGSILTRIVSSGRCNSFPNLKGLAAGIVRLIEAIGGSYYPKPGTEESMKKYAGQNIFFSVAELRLHITQMIAALESDPTSSKILRRQGYSGLFNRMLGGLGQQVSIRKSINALTGIIFHETFGQPCPYFKPGEGGSVQGGKVTTTMGADPRFKPIADGAGRVRQIIQDLRNFPLVNPDAIRNDEELRLSAAETRYKQQETLATSKRILSQTLVRGRGLVPSAVEGKLSQSVSLIGRASIMRGGINVLSAESGYAAYHAVLDQILALLTAVINATYSSRRTVPGNPARLNQHIMRPDIWFGSPPRCNVLFPEDYDTISYSRSFLQEPTRFLLKTNDEFFGESFLFDKLYFAPQAGSIQQDKARLRDMLKNDLLEHELFTGILPVFEKMGEFNVFAARSGTQKNTSKVGFAQRSTNFLYFKHRFAARQMQIAGKFNPYIAVGFPGLVIDKYVDEIAIKAYNELIAREGDKRFKGGSAASRILGTNFLANFTEVSHFVSQADAQGRTEINCGYARQTDESTEFLGALRPQEKVRRKLDRPAVRSTDVAAIDAPKLGAKGPMNGTIVNVVDVTRNYTRASGGSKFLPLFGAPRRDQGGQLKTALVPIGVTTTAGTLSSPDVLAATGSLDREVVFKAFRVDEQVDRYRREEVDIPAEEYIRPGWYGDVWSTANIGKAYVDFFGIGSITDAQSVSDGFVGTLPSVNEEMADAQVEGSKAESADDPRRLVPAVAALDQGATIQQAVDFLLLTYSYVRLSGSDVDQFVRSYTWRPIATLVDMFGTSDLQFSDNGEKVTQGYEGFHSRAFGPFDGLEGLAGPDIKDILGLKKGSVTAQRADTRRRKLEAVQAYAASILGSPGILG